MKKHDSNDELRAGALAASHEATRLMQEAFDLLIQGHTREALAKQKEAQGKQEEARLLMKQAAQLGNA